MVQWMGAGVVYWVAFRSRWSSHLTTAAGPLFSWRWRSAGREAPRTATLPSGAGLRTEAAAGC